MEKAISVENLTKKYQEHTAVDGISFDVEKGSFFAFLGENGAGKTTTINILCTFLQKTSGSVRVFGRELGKEDDRIREMTGIVFQNSVLDRELTVRENLLTRGAWYGLGRKEIMSRIEPFMDSFELRDVWDRKYDRLSGGQRRRVDIVRALIHRPRILFLDEPTTGLDPRTRRLVWDHIRKLREEQDLTIFLTTHYMEETADADQVVILDRGKVIASGPPSALKGRHASSRLLWYADRTEDHDRRLDGYTWTYEADHYRLPFREPVTGLLYENRDVMTDYEILRGTMDDVFLNLTGREMQI